MFTLASKLLSTVASPAFQMAYEKGCSIWEARDELGKLKTSIQTIQTVLIDAEKKQESSVAVKDWMKRVRDVLYDADDLFDEVATDDMLKQQIIKEDKLLKKVRASCSKLNPIVSRNSIANKVKDIRKRLLEISNDMTEFHFVICQHEEPISGARKGQDPGPFVDSRDVIGRVKDKEAILDMLLDDDPLVIAVVGIGGMGKTTLAQLVYNDVKVKQRFEERWFACISDISDDEEVLEKIYQSVSGTKDNNLTVGELQARMKENITGKKFLLVLDDVWDDDHGRWINRMGLLSGGAKGSKIIVTTRSLSVARAVDALKTHHLSGLSEDESWKLFKRVAFTREQEKDTRWTDLGKEIVKKCANVPLAIKSIGSLLYTKTTIEEWESFRKEELVKLGQGGQDPVMSVLKLSYDHLQSSLKQCFAYCSLFPKDYFFEKQDLIYLWIAQGYIKPNSKEQTVEEVGHSYFMDLFRMSFFQEATYDGWNEIEECKMHDLIHDLAQQVVAEESITLNTSTVEIKGTPRHASVGCVVGDSSANLAHFLNGNNRLRSLIFISNIAGSTLGLDLDQEFAKLKFLRTLKLPKSGIEIVPSCIGELKHLRYLDMSMNGFKRLPDSITKLLNLCTLNLYFCENLEELPTDLRKLVNLRHLIIIGCFSLTYMPPGFGELASLQHLDVFKVARGTSSGQCGKLGELSGLNLRGELRINSGYEHDWDGVEGWKPFVNLQGLGISHYQGMRIPHWAASGNPSQLLFPNITSLVLSFCRTVKSLPPLRLLPKLKFLYLANMDELEYIEEEEEEEEKNASFFPSLETINLAWLPELKGWSRKVEAAVASKGDVAENGEEHSSQLPSFPVLSALHIRDCKKLKSFPLCLTLRKAFFTEVDAKLILQLFSLLDNEGSCPSTTTSYPSSLESVIMYEVGNLESLSSLDRAKICHLSEIRPGASGAIE